MLSLNNIEGFLSQPPFNLTDHDIEWVKQTFSTLDQEMKVGQLIMPQCFDPSIKNIKTYLKIKPGGLFFALGKKKDLKKATTYLKANSPIPPLIAGDFEYGGYCAAIDGTKFNTQMGVAATNDEKYAEYLGTVVGREAKAMGFNWTFSPVIDINYNLHNPITNNRSFGDQPDLILKMARSHIKAVQKYNVAATAKHWPGDGVDDRDQHLVTSINSFPMKEWRATYGRLYSELIRTGVKSIMSAHIALPAYYEEMGISDTNRKHKPGSLSHELSNSLLRNELGFNGVTVSDATDMIGFTSQGKREEILPKCIASGIDMLLFVQDLIQDYTIVLDGVKKGLISKARLDEAVLRILGLKASLQLHHKTDSSISSLPLDIIDCEEHNLWSIECAQNSITLLKDEQHIIPVSPKKHRSILLLRAGDEEKSTRYFEKILKQAGFKVGNIDRYRKKPQDFDIAILMSCEHVRPVKNEIRIKWEQLGGQVWFPATLPTIFISVANPYHLYEIPQVPTYINTYSFFPDVLEQLLKMLLGHLPFRGQSPVNVYGNLMSL